MVKKKITLPLHGLIVSGLVLSLAIIFIMGSNPANADLLKTYNLPPTGGNFPGIWHNDVIDLSVYAGHIIKLAWRCTSKSPNYVCAFDDVTILEGGTTVIYSENFDSLTEDGDPFTPGPYPTGWTEENYGTACGTSAFYRYWGVDSYRSYSGLNSMACYYNCPNDDWINTSEITLGANPSLDYYYYQDYYYAINFTLHIFDLGEPSPEPNPVSPQQVPVMAPLGTLGLVGVISLLGIITIRKKRT